MEKWLAGTLAATLIISIAPADVFAAETREKQDQAKTAAIPVADPEKDLPAEKASEQMPFDQKDINQDGEITSERTENSKLYYEGEGVYKQEIYTDPIHTKETANADWEDVSPELKTGSKEVGTENTVLNSDFLKQMKNGLYATFEHNDHKLTYSLTGAKGPDQAQLLRQMPQQK